MIKPGIAIRKSIDNGEYFSQTKEWYFQKYLMPAAQRTGILILVSLILIALYVMLDLARISYSDKQYPFSIYSVDQTRYFPVLNSIGQDNENINISVARYFASYYVSKRESYNYEDFLPENLDITLNSVSTLSSRRIFHDYNDYIDSDLNPDSPINKFKNTMRRSIVIDRVEFNGNYPLPERAKVYYRALDRYNDGRQETSNYVADMDFNMSDSLRVIDKDVPLTFLVTRYRTYKL